MAHLANVSDIPLLPAGPGYGRGWVESNAWFDNETGARIDAAVVQRVRRIADAVHDDITASGYWLAYQAGGLYDASGLTVADQLEHSLRHVELSLRSYIAPGVERRLFDSMLVSAVGYVGPLDQISLTALGFERPDSGVVPCSVRAAHLANTLTWVSRVEGVSSLEADRAPVSVVEVSYAGADEAESAPSTAKVASPDALLTVIGYGDLVSQVLAVPQRVKVCLSSRVKKVSYDADAKRVMITVRDEGEESVISCDYCVCTVPLGVLQSGEPNFTTPLSEAKRLSISRLGVGVENKLIMRFEHNFWSESGGFFAVTDARFRFLDYNSFGVNNVLVAMLAPPFSYQYGGKEHCLATVLGALRRVYPDVPEPLAWVVTAWDVDTFSRGSYSFLKVGSSQRDIAELLRPEYNGHLLFAGEATSLLNQQCVHGAANTGILAANKIRAAFGLKECAMPFPLQNDSELDRCATCDKAWDTEQPLIQCEKCDRWYHQECQNLSIADKPHDWCCIKCMTKKRRGAPKRKPSAPTTAATVAAAAAAAAPPPPPVKAATSVTLPRAQPADADCASPTVEFSLAVAAMPDMSKLLELSDIDRAAVRARSAALFADDSLGQLVGDAVQRSVPSARHYSEAGSLMSNLDAAIHAGDVVLRQTGLSINAKSLGLSTTTTNAKKRPTAPATDSEPAAATANKRARAPAKKRGRKPAAAAAPVSTIVPPTTTVTVMKQPAKQPASMLLSAILVAPLSPPNGGGDAALPIDCDAPADAEGSIVDIVDPLPPVRAAKSLHAPAGESSSRITESSIVDFNTVEVQHWGVLGGGIGTRDDAPIVEGYEVRIRVDDSFYFVKTVRNGAGTLGFRIASGEQQWPWFEHLADAWSAAVGPGITRNIVPIECSLGYDVVLVRNILCRLHRLAAAGSGVNLGEAFSKFNKRKGVTMCSMCRLDIKREKEMGVCHQCHRAFHYTCFQKFTADDEPVCTTCFEIDRVPCIKCGNTDSHAHFLMCEYLLDPKQVYYCPVGMHMECAEPPLRHMPDVWFCPEHTNVTHA
jgi:hypothetical protein